jgi:PAS domain S-box-containing protein
MRDIALPVELQEYFDCAPIALSLGAVTHDNALLLTNQRFRELTGYANSEAIGRNCRFLQGNSDNRDAHKKIHAFLSGEDGATLRTPIVNFRKDGTPFVNLLFMSKLRALSGEVRFIFASQFDISRARPDKLAQYDADLGEALSRMNPMLAESSMIIEGAFQGIADAAASIAQAKMTLADLDRNSFL